MRSTISIYLSLLLVGLILTGLACDRSDEDITPEIVEPEEVEELIPLEYLVIDSVRYDSALTIIYPELRIRTHGGGEEEVVVFSDEDSISVEIGGYYDASWVGQSTSELSVIRAVNGQLALLGEHALDTFVTFRRYSEQAGRECQYRRRYNFNRGLPQEDILEWKFYDSFQAFKLSLGDTLFPDDYYQVADEQLLLEYHNYPTNIGEITCGGIREIVGHWMYWGQGGQVSDGYCGFRFVSKEQPFLGWIKMRPAGGAIEIYEIAYAPVVN